MPKPQYTDARQLPQFWKTTFFCCLGKNRRCLLISASAAVFSCSVINSMEKNSLMNSGPRSHASGTHAPSEQPQQEIGGEGSCRWPTCLNTFGRVCRHRRMLLELDQPSKEHLIDLLLAYAIRKQDTQLLTYKLAFLIILSQQHSRRSRRQVGLENDPRN